MSHSLGLELVCLAILACAGLSASWIRPQFAKSSGVALAFAAPGMVLVLPALVMLHTAGLMLAAPLFSVSGLCLAAGAIFAPTRHTRFRDFERHFWAYVTHSARSLD